MKSLTKEIWSKGIRYNRKKFGVKFPFDIVKNELGMCPTVEGKVFFINGLYTPRVLLGNIRDNLNFSFPEGVSIWDDEF